MSNQQNRQSGLFLPQRGQSVQGAPLLGMVLAWAALIGISCSPRAPKTRIEPESKVVIPAPPRISLKPYHRSMRDGMQRSFDQADEIIIGIYTGNYTDGPKGRAYYFDRFRVFSKDTWTWGPEMNALLPVLFQDVQPEIISSQEFKSLPELDKTGICWDDYEGPRVVFLAEGIPTLVFLRIIFDEVESASLRILIDTYPVTKECRAKDVFDLMLRERAGI